MSKLIAIEGIDRCGKSTLISGLQKELSYDNWFFTQEPSDGYYGQLVRDSLSNVTKPTPSEFFLFLADRYEHHKNVIEPAMYDGKNVITDRYYLSTLAYQSKVVDEGMNMIKPLEYIDYVSGPFTVQSDVTLYIDVPVDVSMERMGEDREKYENRDRLEEAKRIYDYYADTHDNIVRLDGTLPEEELLEEALQYVRA